MFAVESPRMLEHILMRTLETRKTEAPSRRKSLKPPSAYRFWRVGSI